MLDELYQQKIPMLRKTPLGIDSQILNENCDDSHVDALKVIGAILSYSLLSMQPFSLNLDKSFWKLIVGKRLDRDDLMQYELVEDIERLTDSEVEARI